MRVSVCVVFGVLLSLVQDANAAELDARPEPNLKVEDDDAEPVKCFKVAWQSEDAKGLGLPMGDVRASAMSPPQLRRGRR